MSVKRVVAQALAARRLRRRIRAVPWCSVAAAPEHTLVRISGISRPLGPALEAPLSLRVCVFYAIIVYDWHFDGSVRTLLTEQESVPFSLVDATGRAMIDPACANVSSDYDHTTRSWPMRRAAAVEALLARHGLADFNWLQTAQLEACEAILELDERITVVGAGTHEPDPVAMPSGGYRDAAVATWLALTGTAREPLLISDDPSLAATS